MESEERPSKMRKLAHAEEGDATIVVDSTPANVGPEAQNDIPNEDQLPKSTDNEATNAASSLPEEAENSAPKLSKNQMKKQARLEKWESGRDDRKLKRRRKSKSEKSGSGKHGQRVVLEARSPYGHSRHARNDVQTRRVLWYPSPSFSTATSTT